LSHEITGGQAKLAKGGASTASLRIWNGVRLAALGWALVVDQPRSA
jgi:hypothetical protein